MKENEDYNNNHYILSEDDLININEQEINLNLNENYSIIKQNPEKKKNKDLYTVFLGSNNELNSPLYETNKISTSKYTLFNFLPKILMEQFSRICNIYFLIIAMLQTIKSISYSGGSPLILIPFSSILLLNGLKDFIEDRKRVKSDWTENNNDILIYDKNTKRFIKEKWEKIKLGDIIQIKNNEQFPCDLLFLESSPESKGQCKIETKNINGETNLQTKKINYNNKNKQLDKFNYFCLTKKPNEYIYEFEAVLYGLTHNLIVNKNDILYYNYENFILRGSGLRQTEYIIGVAVYIGHNTKSMRNSPLAKQKLSKLEISMNYQILFIFIFQVILSILASIIHLITFYSKNAFIEKFVNIAENKDNFFSRFIKIVGTWTLLLTNFVPIPLLSSLEFIKLFQGWFMSLDVDMINKYSLQKVKVQSSTLNDELGLINYIFTDKTGTLTKNNMTFRAFTLGEKSFGKIDLIETDNKNQIYEIRDRYGKITNVGFIDKNKELNHELENKDKNGNYLIENFFLNIILNNSIIVDNKKFNEKKEIEYLTSSTDEKCLINFARFCGYTFINRSVDNTITIEKIIEGKLMQLNYKICNIFEFTSERQRMSVIIKSKDFQGNDNYILYIKGSDYIINKKVKDKNTNMYKTISSKIKEYSEKGLRILVFGYKVISEEDYNKFDNKYKEILYDINHSQKDLFNLYDELENDIELIGATAIEDQLQYNVENTIYKFVSIGIKVCMLTGDKLETAKSIASSCKLISPDMNLIYLVNPFDSNEKLENHLFELYNKELRNNRNNKYCLLMTGEVFSKITQNQNCINLFAQIFSLSETIICCRFSPKQKAELVHIIKSINPEKITLAIGDGANDVGMISEADVGIGIEGIEGVEAARASDYSLPQFSFLQKLLLFHGRESYRRNSNYIIYEFYKNIVYTSPFFYFGFINFFTGESFYDAVLMQCFDMFYSIWPMFYYSIFDKEYETELYTERPEIYKSGLQRKYFNNKIFWKNIILGFIEGLMITINSCFFYEIDNKGYTDDDIISLGIIVFSGVVLCVNIKVLLRVCVFDVILIILFFSSIGAFYFTILILSTTELDEILQYGYLLIDNFSYLNILDTNEHLINKRKYFVFFLFVIFFVCFLDIAANRINFKYLINTFKENKSFLLFEKDKYLIDGINKGIFINSDNEKDENDKDKYFIDDDRELLKNQNGKKDINYNNSINENSDKKFNIELEI